MDWLNPAYGINLAVIKPEDYIEKIPRNLALFLQNYAAPHPKTAATTMFFFLRL
jgi:hypothetical protein